jgi:hypothetical protein
VLNCGLMGAAVSWGRVERLSPSPDTPGRSAIRKRPPPQAASRIYLRTQIFHPPLRRYQILTANFVHATAKMRRVNNLLRSKLDYFCVLLLCRAAGFGTG